MRPAPPPAATRPPARLNSDSRPRAAGRATVSGRGRRRPAAIFVFVLHSLSEPVLRVLQRRPAADATHRPRPLDELLNLDSEIQVFAPPMGIGMLELAEVEAAAR